MKKVPKIKSRRRKRIKSNLYVEQNGKCRYCRRNLIIIGDRENPLYWTLEHIVPRRRGGTNHIGNLGLSCYQCNQEEKGRKQNEGNPSH